MAYNVNGRLIEKVDPVGNRTVLRYRDGDGVSPGATYTDNLHGFVSDLLRLERPKGSDTGDPNDFATRFELDARGNVTASIDGAGGRAETYYLDWGLVDYEKDPAGNTTSYHQYDPSGLPKEVWDPKNGQAYYAYDAVGNVTAKADPRSQPFGGLSDTQKRYRTTLTYDAQDRLKTEQIPKRSEHGAVHHPLLRLQRQRRAADSTDGNGKVSTSSFDAMDNVLQTGTPARAARRWTTSNATETTKYTYDAEQNVSSETRPIGSRPPRPTTTRPRTPTTTSTARSSSAAARAPRPPARTSSPATPTTAATTSSARATRRRMRPGRPTRRPTPATAARQRVAFTYDKADRQTVVVEDPSGLQLTTRTDYDEDDNVVRVRDARNKGAEFGPADPLTPDVAYETTYTYDGADRPIGQARDGSRTEVVRRADGLVAQVRHPRYFTAEATNADDFVSKYGYDAPGRHHLDHAPAHRLELGRYASFVRTLSLTRDAVGNATTVTDPRGLAFTNTYLDTGDLLTTTRPSAWTFSAGAGGGEVDAQGRRPARRRQRQRRRTPSPARARATSAPWRRSRARRSSRAPATSSSPTTTSCG